MAGTAAGGKSNPLTLLGPRGWALASAGVAVLLLVLPIRSDNIQKLAELPQYSWLASIQNGEGYVVDEPPGPAVRIRVRALPLGRTPGREVLSVPGDEGFAEVAGVTRDGVYCLITPSAASARDGAGGGLAGRAATSRRSLLHAPLTGDDPRTLFSGRDASRVVVTSRLCYWLQHVPDSDHVELMVTSPAGGAPRRAASGPWDGWFASLRAGRDGVFWLTGGGDPDGLPDLVYLPDGQQQARIVRGFTGVFPPVDLDGQLYWLEPGSARDEGGVAAGGLASPGSGGPRFSAEGIPGVAQRLVTLPRDGTERQVLLDLSGSRDPVAMLSSLIPSGDSLYVLLTELPPGADRPLFLPSVLCRVRRKAGSPLEKLCRLPADRVGPGFIDQGWYYFVVRETREPWLNWQAPASPADVFLTLHRFRLPQ